MAEKKTEKKKWTTGQCALMVCILGPLDTGGAWLMHAKGWVVIDLIFWPVLFFALLVAKIKEDSK
jgi:hypothetical protein